MRNASAYSHAPSQNQPGSLALNRQDDAANEHVPQAANLRRLKAGDNEHPQTANLLWWKSIDLSNAAACKSHIAHRKSQTQPVQVCEGSMALAPPFKKACPF
ncbi:hypothetical protein [Limnobacter thiooxidans]|uniref:hypothetical protein n=1 Tax=Limnobacter thiooxidans TaxID=131080 RepID=UPI00102DFF91